MIGLKTVPTASFRPTMLAKRPSAETMSMVFGSFAVFTVWMPIISLLTWAFAFLGLVFGVFALRRAARSRTAIAGVGLSLAGLLGCLAWMVVFNSSVTVRPSRPGEHGVTYSVVHEEQRLKVL